MIICHICGATDETTELVKCEQCGKFVCSQSDECSEVLNDDQYHCKECLSKQSKYDCNDCLYQDTDECPLDSQYSYCYDCSEFCPRLHPEIPKHLEALFVDLENDSEFWTEDVHSKLAKIKNTVIDLLKQHQD